MTIEHSHPMHGRRTIVGTLVEPGSGPLRAPVPPLGPPSSRMSPTYLAPHNSKSGPAMEDGVGEEDKGELNGTTEPESAGAPVHPVDRPAQGLGLLIQTERVDEDLIASLKRNIDLLNKTKTRANIKRGNVPDRGRVT